MKSNSYKKDYQEDKFGRKYYCKRARLNLARSDKKIGKRITRRKLQRNLKKDLTNKEFCDIIWAQIKF